MDPDRSSSFELPPALALGQSVGVGIRELSREPKAVLESLGGGRRGIITWHGEPKALLLGVREAVELALDRELREAEDLAQRDWLAGDVTELSAPGSAFRIVLSARAASSLDGCPGTLAPRLRRVLHPARGDGSLPVWISILGRDFVMPFSSTVDPAAVLVHDVFDAGAVLGRLAGARIQRDVARRRAVRLAHCRPLRR